MYLYEFDPNTVIHKSHTRKMLQKYQIIRAYNVDNFKNDYNLSDGEKVKIYLKNIKNGFTEEKIELLKLQEKLDKRI